MSNRNENVIVVTLESIELGKEFIEWPLHITIVPWFHGYDAAKLDKMLEKITSKHKPFTAKVGEIEKFGPKKDVEVNVIDDSPELKALHLEVFNTLEANNFIIHQKDFVNEEYRAHITRQPIGYKSSGDAVRIESIALVKQKRLKKSGEIVKAIIKQYELG